MSQIARNLTDGAKAHDNLGTALAMSGQAAAAIGEYRTAVSADRQSSFAALNLGLTLAAQKEPEEASRWLEQALRLDPAQPEAHLALGETLKSEGLKTEALVHRRTARGSCGPADPKRG